MDCYSLCTVLLVLLITCLLAKYRMMMLEKAKLPPGPTPLPIIGTLYKMNISNIVHSLLELQKTYGDIFTIYQGNRPCVVLCGYKAIKETLIDKAEEFSGRAYYPSFYDFTKGDDMTFSNGEKWKELRHFTLLTLSNFGMGKRSIEERIKEEAGYLIDVLRKTNVLLVLLITCLLAKYRMMMLEKAKLPPGPTPLPIIGTLYKMNISNIVHSLLELQKTYGDMFTIYQGNRPCVVLCGYKAIKETLIDKAEEFSGRAYYPSFYDFTKGDDMTFSNGEKWKELRHFTLLTLSNFGMGKRSIEERIKEEAGYLIDVLRKTNGSLIDPKNQLHCSVSNVICSVLFGKRFDYQDEEFQNIMHCIQDSIRIMSNPWGLLYNTYPEFMKYIPGPHMQIMKNFTSVTDYIKKRVENNMKTLDINNPRDFIDCFLIKIEKEEKTNGSYYNHKALLMNTMTLIVGGTETVANTLCYIFLLLLKHPNVAEKVYHEIDDVIGCRSPNYEDRHNMPYTEAFIHEVQRYANVAPLGLPHELIMDTKIRNYTFREGTMFLTLLAGVHFDKTQFNNPEDFNPNNFLDEHGKFKNNNALMPFSAGKRICPGMSLANMEIFLYVTTMLQNFTIKSMVPLEEISIAPVGVGIVQIPPNYEIYLLPR
ncbi:cytochrome P450 2F2-like isoform X2 [Pseudophryne corroboree]